MGGLRRAVLEAIAVPFFVQSGLYLHVPAINLNDRLVSYDECMTRLEPSFPGFTKASGVTVQKYPWRRRNGKSLSDPYETPIRWDEFERIPEGEPMQEIRVTSLRSYATCNIAGNLLTLSQAFCIFGMSLTYASFYFDFVFATSLEDGLLG